MKTLLVSMLALLTFTAARADDVTITPDVVYGHKDGLALTYDVLRPANADGAAVLWIQSGGWYSGWTEPRNFLVAGKPYLDKGFTLYVVRHGSAPRYNILEAAADVRRAVRHIRGDAKRFDVDPDRLGVVGGSAGGHLTLVLATTGDDGDPQAKDPVLKQSSRIAAAAALYPPTDLRTWVTDPPKPIREHPRLKEPLSFDPARAPEVSPLVNVDEKTAPILLIHGDKDELVPIEHSTNIVAALDKTKVPHKLVTIEGAAHGFSKEQTASRVVPELVGWFEKHLAKVPGASRP